MNGTTTPKPSQPNNMNTSKPHLKNSASGKTLDSARKQAASPVDGSSSRKPQPKAWTGTNPITNRPTSTSNANGAPQPNAKNAAPLARPQQQPSSSDSADNHANDRLLFLIANFTGLDVSVKLKNGEQFVGIFSSASLEASGSQYTLKMAKRTSAAAAQQVNGNTELPDEFVGTSDDFAMTFDFQDTVDLAAANVDVAGSATRAQNAKGVSSSFRTDADISGNLALRERELQRWQPGPDTSVDLSLESSTAAGGWDQFAENERLYNVQSDYNEDMYTTTIDRSDPLYRQREAEAVRIAREIEGTAASNPHVEEERRMNAEADSGLDEEDKYSGVRRDPTPSNAGKGTGNAYVPPARRPITSQPTVRGAPYDPAIIQMSRPAPAAKDATDATDTTAPTEKEQQKTQVADTLPKITVPSQEAAVPLTVATATPSTTAAPTPATTAALTPSVPQQAAPAQKSAPAEGVTENIERKVLDSFKQFKYSERLRMEEQTRNKQERKRETARQEKSVKLNDLKKFAQNFKLYTPVPQDLVPILAKDKEKQELIVEKAKQQALEKEQRSISQAASPAASQATVTATDPKAQRTIPTAPQAGAEPASPSAHRQRAPQALRAQHPALQSPRGPGQLSQRVAANQAQYNRSGFAAPNLPSPLPIRDTRKPSVDQGISSPTSAISGKALNVKAMEFKPNPGASTFVPTGPSSAASANVKRPSVSASRPKTDPAIFFPAGKKIKSVDERVSLADTFNPVKRMLEETPEEEKKTKYANNGGIPHAFRTPPTWESTVDKSYKDMFAKSVPPPMSSVSPMHTPNNAGLPNMPHQHQLPAHLQAPVNGAPPTAHQTPPRFPPNQSYMAGPNQAYEDPRMQFASAASVAPSPRMGHPAMAYNNMHPGMPGQGMPGHFPGYGMQQPVQMGGHMMVQQHSQGGSLGPGMSPAMGMRNMHVPPMQAGVPQFPMTPHMNTPHMQSPMPGHAQPHFNAYQMQPNMPGGFANSPSRGGMGLPMSHSMSHQGSQQGHQPPPPGQYIPNMPPNQGGQNPNFGPMTPMRNPAFPQPMPQFQQGGQYPANGYPMQQRNMSNSGYNPQMNMTPRQYPAQPMGAMNNGQMPGMMPQGMPGQNAAAMGADAAGGK